MRKWLIPIVVITICLTTLLLSGGIAFAASSTAGFKDALQAMLDGFALLLDHIIDLFKAIPIT